MFFGGAAMQAIWVVLRMEGAQGGGGWNQKEHTQNKTHAGRLRGFRGEAISKAQTREEFR